MPCTGFLDPTKPAYQLCPTTLFGIPRGVVGREVGGEQFTIQGIVLHCIEHTLTEYDNMQKCATPQTISPDGAHASLHYLVSNRGAIRQYVEDGDISWGFQPYLSNIYPTPPPPPNQIVWGINDDVTPDAYVLNIGMETSGFFECDGCPGPTTLEEPGYQALIQLLAYLAHTYNIELTTDFIQFHENIEVGVSAECLGCRDIAQILEDVGNYCEPCVNHAPCVDQIEGVEVTQLLGVTAQNCCDDCGCLGLVNWDNCLLGSTIPGGDINQPYGFVGINFDGDEQCLVYDNINVECPITGDGIDGSPFTIDKCCIEAWLDCCGPLSQINRLMGVDDNGCWTLEDPDSFLDRILCAQPENENSEPEWILVKGETCPEWATPEDVVAAGLNVIDGNCIDLTFVDGDLTAEIIIAPPQGGIPNTLVCGQDGLYSPQTLPVAGDCVEVVDNGDGTYTISAEISANQNNAVSCEPDGLFVEAPDVAISGDCIEVVDNQDGTFSIEAIIAPSPQGDADNNLTCIPGQGLFVPKFQVLEGFTINMALSGSYDHILTTDVILSQDPTNILSVDFTPGTGGLLTSFTTLNTNCIELNFAGGVLSANPVISPDAGNQLVCQANGLYVPSLDQQLAVQDTACIDLTLAGNILSADPILSGSIGGINNILTCEATGMYVPVGAGIAANDTDCINLTLTTGGQLTADLIIDPAADNQLVCGGSGAYVPPGAGINVSDTNCISLNFAGNVLTANPIIDPDPDNQLACGVNGLFVGTTNSLIAVDTDCIDMEISGNEISADIILAGPQGGNPNILNCIPGEGLYVGESAGIVVNDTPCISLDLTSGVLTAVPVINPDPNNQLVCDVNGLFVDVGAGLQVLDTDCVNLTLAGDALSADLIFAGAQVIDGQLVQNANSCLPGEGLYAPLWDRCSLGAHIEAQTPTTAEVDGFVILDPATDCLTRGDRLHNLNSVTLPVAEGFADGYTVGSKWRVPAGTFPGQIRDIEYLMVGDGRWIKTSGGTQAATGAQPSTDVIPSGIQFVPDLTGTAFDVLGEVDLVNDELVSLAGGSLQTHIAAQLGFPAIPAGTDVLVEMGVLINGFSSFSPIIERFHDLQPGDTVNIAGVTQLYSIAPGDVVEVFIRHDAGSNSDLTSYVVNHYATNNGGIN